MELTMDARLRRMWRQYAEPELRGIAGVKAGNSATVVAVVNREPGAYEGSRLRETFGDHFEDRNLHLVAAVADSYGDLVRAWFKQVDGSPGRLVWVRSLEDDSVLRIGVDQALRSTEERARGLSVGSQSDREALRRLVPHERVEFVAADTTG
jgi:beta-phosphoglucomutase-like phosphatase (HAD superfamily)